MIIVDLYLGNQFPEQAETGKFLKKIKQLLVPNGLIVFNRLRLKDNANLKFFGQKLTKCFPRVDLVETATNLFFLAESKN